MPRGPTTPLESDGHGVPIRTLRVEVVEGPDAGRVCDASSETLSVGTAEGNDLVLSDPTVSRYHADLSQRGEGVLVVDHGSTNGIVVGQVKVVQGFVHAGATIRIGRTKVRVLDGEGATVELHPDAALGGLRGRSLPMRRLMARVARGAPSDVPVLLVGESGTGKELIARALHDLSPRRAGPFEVVDCGSLTPSLVASELFGHERGAFTGAERQHEGAFERARGGTLFLDEVGELPAELQPTLLGALERRRFRRVGGSSEVEVDVRLVSATNRDLRAAINVNAFRLDLYYRLAVLVLPVPPLRDRPEDVPLLVGHVLDQLGHPQLLDELFPEATMSALCTHSWPGNVRELRNLVEATVALGETPDMPGSGATPRAAGEPLDPSYIPTAGLLARPFKQARADALAAFEVRYLHNLLERTQGNVSRAAREAGIDRSYLFELLRRHGLR